MLHNLEAEIARRHIKKKEIAEAINVDEKTLWNKINCVTAFTMPEATAIKDTFFPTIDLQYLFASDDEEAINSK